MKMTPPPALRAFRNNAFTRMVPIQTLHNYRLLCPNAILFRDGHVCEECVSHTVKWPSVLHGCYRNNRAASAVTATMLAAHSAKGTWRHDVDRYIALTKFARAKFVEGGLPAERLAVRPNFLAADLGMGSHTGGFALFVGRLAAEKGIATLLQAWRIAGAGRTLKIVGAGPLEGALDRSVPNVEWLGALPNREVLSLMRDAAFLVFPSACYENFPITLCEAFATGLPVLASRHGAMSEIVAEGRTGRLFTPGDSAELAALVAWAFAHPDPLKEMGLAARRAYELAYSADPAYARLMAIYEEAIESGAGTR